MDPCVFCRILAGELPSSPVLDNDLIVAFLDIRPANPGHTLVLPRRHVESFTELSPTEVEQLALCGQRIAAALKQGFDGCEAVTFSLADGAAAGQDVPHTHLHVVRDEPGTGSVGERPVSSRLGRHWTRAPLNSGRLWVSHYALAKRTVGPDTFTDGHLRLHAPEGDAEIAGLARPLYGQAIMAAASQLRSRPAWLLREPPIQARP